MQFAIELPSPFFAIHGFDSGHQLRGFAHVSRATRMHHELRIGKGTHHGSGTPCVLEMNMREHHVIHCVWREAKAIQHG